MVTWTPAQMRRLRELGADEDVLDQDFESTLARDRCFADIEGVLCGQARRRLLALREQGRRPYVCQLEDRLVEALTRAGFVQVRTPIIISREFLEKMSITDRHPLWRQVYWVEDGACLRPMLAPGLYCLLRALGRLWDRPIRIFEVGPCFRRESRGVHHLSEFTMLNLVEMGTPTAEREVRMRELAALVMETAGVAAYELKPKSCVVYGQTTDVVAGLEVGSGAMGPHPLDGAWGITENWVGIGFGLERLAAVKEGSWSIGRYGRSLRYLDGVCLNV